MRRAGYALVGLLCLAFLSCAGGPSNQTGSTKGTVSLEAVEDRMETFYNNGKAKIAEGSISEGIQQLVAVLAEKDKLSTSNKAIDDFAARAKAELTTIGSALVLDASMEWLDENKNQISASILDVGTPKGLQPSVILSYNMGRGRTLVAGAPVIFEFVEGMGTITGYVTTNEYGQANSSVARLDAPNAQSIIRAYLAYTVNGYTYRFRGVERDFAYVPPVRRATILVLERSGAGANQPPVILDPVYNTLKGVAFDFSSYDGVLMGGEFMKVFAGDPDAIKALGMKKDVSYLVMVLNDGLSASQVVFEGKAYNLYKSKTTATTRIIRVADGKILYSGACQGVDGQGSSVDAAVLDGYKNGAAAMAAKLKLDLPEIDKALAAPVK